MVTWIHVPCGNPTEFDEGDDPNRRQIPCPNCGVAVGEWRRG